MQVLTDAPWAKFEAAIVATKIRGARPRKEDRRTIEAMRLDNGAKWRSIPAEFGDWHHAYLRFRRWTVRSVWDRIMAHVVAQGGAEIGLRLHRRHGGAGAPEGCWRAPEQTAPLTVRFIRGAPGQAEALGRSRGGFGAKIVGVCDAAVRLVDFVLTPSQAHELAPSLVLLKRLPEAPGWALADMACNAREFRSTAGRWAPSPLCRRASGRSTRSPVQLISTATAT